MSLRILFTLDYEIHGNGDGDPMELIIKPTYSLLELLNIYNAKLTIFADVAEILKFKEYYKNTGVDRFYSNKIEEQLQLAIKQGHDVQLHVHSSYLNSVFDNNSWTQVWSEYDMTRLPFERIDSIIKECKSYLEKLFVPVKSDYKCNVYRAANWSMMPTENIAKALIKNGFIIDTSVYKWGCQSGNVKYDYTNAHSNLFPYKASIQDINFEDKTSTLYEFPIYSELRGFISFISFVRLYRMIRAKFHKHKIKGNSGYQNSKVLTNKKDRKVSLIAFFKKHAWKLDFSQSSGRQMINATKRAYTISMKNGKPSPLVLIGHSKTFFLWNSVQLKRYLNFIKESHIGEFSLFKDCEIYD